ncbi:phosphotransferase [Nitratireductor sp. XY-223]|uniref:phosphotransferase enzyme family protein n=1 Tax=Nitratireductor sp. XY-223 TaxID=2561926 RepID=UPI0010AA4ECC|nr:phosphotransferase [Nitratireductor sp. XY-223]
MSDRLVDQALGLWGLSGTGAKLVARRENRVYRVDAPDGRRFALRLHRPDYRSDAELQSELDWLTALSCGGLRVPLPVASKEQRLLQQIDGTRISLLTWLDGAAMGRTGEPLDINDRTAVFASVGETMARMHALSDAWTPPAGFVRCAWDAEGLIGDEPLWGRFRENPQLTARQAAVIAEASERARADLQIRQSALDYGLIHADLVRENVLISNGAPQLIDFDDGGYGFRLFDIATTLLKNRGEPDYPELQAALLEGYRRVRPIDTRALPLFVLLRAFTYLGWIVPRMHEPGATERCGRFIENATVLSREYLGA